MEIMMIFQCNKTRNSAAYQRNCCRGNYHLYQNIHVGLLTMCPLSSNFKVCKKSPSVSKELTKLGINKILLIGKRKEAFIAQNRLNTTLIKEVRLNT